MSDEDDWTFIEMNEIRRGVSDRVQCGAFSFTPKIDEPGKAGTSRSPEHKEMTMLKTISAALIATSLIAAPAFAANAGTAAATTQTQTQSQPTADTTAPAKTSTKMTSSKSKKLHASAKLSRHHSKKISLHKTHAKVAAKVGTKPVAPATKRG